MGNNVELRKVIFKVTLASLLLIILVSTILWIQVNEFKKDYVHHNTKALGNLIMKFPELEHDIVTSYIGDMHDSYQHGKDVLKRYSYDGELSIAKTPLLNSFYFRALF